MSMDQALRGAMCMVRPMLQPCHRLVSPPPDGSLAVLAGEGQLEQIIVNLSLNAIDAMPSGGCLEVEVQSDPDRIRLLVRDTGYGMDQDTLNRVFEPFFSTRHSKGGTGLGLAAVYAIVKQLEGRIQVQSAPGEGTCFTVELPRCEAPLASGPAPIVSSRPPSTIHILAVDDQASVLQSLSAGLVSAGYRVTTAASAEDALGKLHKISPTLLLVDVRMPGQSGIELLAKVRTSYPEMPVIMMTGHSDEDVESGKYGAQWLLKPFTPEKLSAAINSALA